MKTPNIEDIKAEMMKHERFVEDLEIHSMTFEECGIIQLSNETGRFKKDEEVHTRDIQNGWRDITIMVNVNALPISYQCNIINDDEERAKRLARVGIAS
jgi:hypothetical protein